MRNIALAAVIVLLALSMAPSTASAAWTYVGPAPMIVPGPVPYTVNYAPAPMVAPAPVPYVVNYAPVATLWGPVAPPVMVPGRVVVRRVPVVYAPPAPVVYGSPAPVGYVPPVPVVYGPSPVVRYKVYYPGMPVRNTLRAILP